MRILQALRPWALPSVFLVVASLRLAAQAPSPAETPTPIPAPAAVPAASVPEETRARKFTNRTECVQVRLETNEVEQVSVLVDDVLVTTLKRLREAGGGLLTNCVSLRLADDKESIQVWANCRRVCFGGWGFDGWEAQLPEGGQMVVKADFQNGLLDVASVAGNPEPVQLSFIDGTIVQLPGGSGGRLDVMKDGTYVFAVRQSAGPVLVRSAEGQAGILGAGGMPLTGGPSVEVRDANGQVQRIKLSPTVGVTVTGSPGSDYVLSVGGQELRVGVGQSRTVTMPNGTSLVLSQDATGGALTYAVTKGDFRLGVGGVEGLQVVGSTGQNGVLGWSVSERWVEVSRGAVGDPTVVGLQQGASAILAGAGSARFGMQAAGGVEVQPKGTDLTVLAEFAPGWTAQVAGGNAARFDVNREARVMDVAAGSGNTAPVMLNFVDGGRAELAAGGGGRVDVMQDRSYVFQARGNVSARDAEGRGMVLTENTLPMTGGPLVAMKDANGQAQMVRLSPTVAVAITGNPGSEFLVQAGGQEVRVGPGQSRVVTMPNGTSVVFAQGATGGALTFSVAKGDFRLGVGGLEGMQVVGLSGQNGVLGWSLAERFVDVSNASGQVMVVGLPSGLSAGVAGQGGGRFAWGVNQGLEARARGDGLTVVADGLTGWNAQVPGGNSAGFVANRETGVFHVTAGAENRGAVGVQFLDGARVNLDAGAVGQLDAMRDQTYVFTARGNATGRTVDGQEFPLNENSLPLTGGPLVEVKDANGQIQQVRLSPTVAVRVSGASGSDYVVNVGGQEVRVGVGQSRTVTLPNGTSLVLSQDPSGGALTYAITKGDFRLGVGAVPGIEVVGLIGQNGVLDWNVNERWVDVSTGPGPGVTVVGLPGGASAGVAGQGGGRFGFTEQGGFEAQARGNGLTVVAEPVPGWSAQVPGGNTAGFLVNRDVRVVDVTTGAANPLPVVMHFVDGARAELAAGTGGRVDVMRDRSYVFTARGNVNGRNADGQEFAMTESSLPLTGGPWVDVKDASGQIQRVRLSPTVAVTVTGNPGSDFLVNVGGQSVRVGVGQSQTVAMPNGTSLVFSQDASGGALTYAVAKGDFRLSVGGMEAMQVVGLTGQNGVLSWNGTERWLDVGNGNGQVLVVGLPGGASAGVAGRAGGRFGLTAGQGVDVQSRGNGLTLVTEGAPGWNAQVTGGNGLALLANRATGVVDLTATAGNTAPVIVRFVDGGRVELAAGNGGRVDVMRDQSYVFTARGSVSGRTAEGRDLLLTENSLPLTGGPVVEVKDANGQVRRVRLSPTVAATVSGDAGSGYVVNIGGQEVRVGVGQSQTVTMPNGTSLVLSQEPTGGALTYAVTKGDFRLGLGSLEGMQVVGLTGQNGVLAWNVSERWLEVANGSGQPMVVGLPAGVSAGLAAQGGGRFGFGADQSLEVQARGPGLAVVAESLAGWNMVVPGGNSAGLVVNREVGMADVRAGAGNRGPVVMSFVDGGRADILPGTGGRIDVMQDRSYVFSARGNVLTRSGEGREVTLNENSLPLTGGPLVEVKDANGQSQWVRLSPTVGVAVTGNPGSDYVLNVGGQEVRVGAGQSRTVTMPNGTSLVLTQDPTGGGLVYSVAKGDFRLAVGGLEGMQVVALTGQNGVLGWNVSERWLDVGNGSGQPVVVGLPSGASAGVAAQGGGRFGLTTSQGFDAQSRGSGLTVVAEAVPGWNAQIPGGNAAGFVVNQGVGLVDVMATAGNKAPVVLNFVDGARLNLTAGTGGRVDVMRDLSYLFTARGNVTGRDGAGTEVALTDHSLPMTGGPVTLIAGANGKVERVRLSPTTEVLISGVVGRDVTIRIGDQTLTLDQATPQTVTMPNGGSVTFSQNPATRTVNWQVQKGDFRISVEGITSWQAIALTGLSAGMAWNVDTLTVALAIDITNTSSLDPANTLLVALPASVTARVAPGATFQYAGEVNSNNFQTSSHGGTVVLANLNTGQSVDLEAGSVSFAGGRPLIRGASFQPNEPVTLTFNANASVELSGLLGNVAIPPGTTKLIRGRNGSVLQVSNQPGVGLVLQAVSGEFSFNTDGIRSGTISVPEGSSLSVGYDPASGIFTATPVRGRATVQSGDGDVYALSAGTLMTVISGRLTTSSARPEDEIMFFETQGRGRNSQSSATGNETGMDTTLAAGGGGGGGGGTRVRNSLDGATLNNQLDTSRISQPPASTTGRP